MSQQRKPNASKINVYVDLAIALVFIVVLSPGLTGLALHEWLSLAAGGAIVVHLLLHWQWLVATTRRFFGHVAPQVRFNYVLNGALFIAVTVAIFSGVMISEAVLAFFGLSGSHNFFWRGLHGLSAELSLWLIGLHIALHWKWVLMTSAQYIVAPLRRMIIRRTGTAPQPVAPTMQHK